MVCAREKSSNLGQSSENMFSGAQLVYALQGRGRDGNSSFSAMCLYQVYLDRVLKDTRGALLLGGSHFTTSLGKLEDIISRVDESSSLIGYLGRLDSLK